MNASVLAMGWMKTWHIPYIACIFQWNSKLHFLGFLVPYFKYEVTAYLITFDYLYIVGMLFIKKYGPLT